MNYCTSLFYSDCIHLALSGGGSECPECKVPAWVKDVYLNRQLSNMIRALLDIKRTIRSSNDNQNSFQTRSDIDCGYLLCSSRKLFDYIGSTSELSVGSSWSDSNPSAETTQPKLDQFKLHSSLKLKKKAKVFQRDRKCISLPSSIFNCDIETLSSPSRSDIPTLSPSSIPFESFNNKKVWGDENTMIGDQEISRKMLNSLSRNNTRYRSSSETSDHPEINIDLANTDINLVELKLKQAAGVANCINTVLKKNRASKRLLHSQTTSAHKKRISNFRYSDHRPHSSDSEAPPVTSSRYQEKMMNSEKGELILVMCC